MKKVIILIGNYGSGKTEIALNMAVRAAAEGKRTQVIDLDRINDYFRMSDHVRLLEDRNINLVSPTFFGAGITQTNMPAAVGSAFAQDWDLVLFDVGGDPAGALSLARYHMDFAALEPGQLEVYDIVNIRRPMSETAEKILKLKDEMEGFAEEGPHLFPDDMITDQPERQICAELIREKLLRCLEKEIPHGTAVEITRFSERDNGIIDIEATIFCEKESHKGIIIGKKGAMLKKVGELARADMEQFLGARVNLQTWVKVKESWRDSLAQLRNFGYTD